MTLEEIILAHDEYSRFDPFSFPGNLNTYAKTVFSLKYVVTALECSVLILVDTK
jgi:hypothetical protein